MEKLNIAEILKDCQEGTELDCPMFDGTLEFYRIDNDTKSILCRIKTNNGGYIFDSFTKYGCYTSHEKSKCVIFPKGKTTWEGFQRPFKDGDVIIDSLGAIHILKNSTTSYCYFDVLEILETAETSCIRVIRLATKEEKQQLFDAIKANGYKWNAETKTLERLEVNKFDITKLKPFDKVLVRDTNKAKWVISFFSHCNNLETYKYSCINGVGYAQCIPYENNRHLLGTEDDCDEYFKTWE